MESPRLGQRGFPRGENRIWSQTALGTSLCPPSSSLLKGTVGIMPTLWGAMSISSTRQSPSQALQNTATRWHLQMQLLLSHDGLRPAVQMGGEVKVSTQPSEGGAGTAHTSFSFLSYTF